MISPQIDSLSQREGGADTPLSVFPPERLKSKSKVTLDGVCRDGSPPQQKAQVRKKFQDRDTAPI